MEERLAPTRESADFFFSYTAADEAWAEWIAWWLELAGYEVVFQKWDFRPGQNFALQMQNAGRFSKHTVAVLTADYLEADNCKAEWSAAFVQDPDCTERRLIGIRVGDCRPEGLLRGSVYIDLVGLPTAHEAAVRLLHGVRQGRAKMQIEPCYPGGVVEWPAPHDSNHGGTSDA